MAPPTHRTALRTALLHRAGTEAAAAVEKHTTLRGAQARKAAQAALAAGGDALRAEHAIRLAMRPDAAGLAAGLVAAGLDVTVYALIAAGRNPRSLRKLAAAAVALRLGLVGYTRWRAATIRAQLTATINATGATE